MKIISQNLASSVTATSANTAYPAANLLNNSPKKKWQVLDSTVTSATLSVDVSGTTGGLGVVGIVADSAAVTIYSPTGIDWQNVDWPDVDWIVGESDMDVTSEWVDQPNGTASLWVEFPQFVGSVAIRIELTKITGSPKIIGAGVLVVGEISTIPGGRYPISEGLVDYSTERQLSNGAFYYRDRDRVRTFSGEINVNRAAYFYKFMRDFAQVNGKNPAMMLLVDDMGNDWVVYGRLSDMPAGSHYSKTRSNVQFQIIEVL